MLFKCKLCSEKDRRIDDLKAHIASLEALTIPKNDPFKLPIIQYEADAILSGQQHQTDVSESSATDLIIMDTPEAEEIRSERDRLLSGTY